MQDNKDRERIMKGASSTPGDQTSCINEDKRLAEISIPQETKQQMIWTDKLHESKTTESSLMNANKMIQYVL